MYVSKLSYSESVFRKILNLKFLAKSTKNNSTFDGDVKQLFDKSLKTFTYGPSCSPTTNHWTE